jgi:hypothetical protein
MLLKSSTTAACFAKLQVKRGPVDSESVFEGNSGALLARRLLAIQRQQVVEGRDSPPSGSDALQQTFRIFSTRGGDWAARPGGCSASGERKAQRLFPLPLFF